MSTEITEAFVKQFNSTVFHLSQQKGSRLRDKVRNEMQKGKSQFFDRIGLVSAVKRTTRHGDTPLNDTPHSRRMVTLNDYSRADLIDDPDRIRLLIDPTSDYVQAFTWGFGRAMDDEIIDKSDAAAKGGEEGGTDVSLGTGQTQMSVDGGAVDDLNIDALRRCKKKFDQADVDESIPRHMAINASSLESLLNENEVQSNDYNSVKALVQGEVNSFMGFNFVRCEQLDNSSGSNQYSLTTGEYDGAGTSENGKRKIIAWAQDGLLLAVGQDRKARVSERDDKEYSTQVYMSMSIGSTRMEEEKVVITYCTEA